MVPLLPTSAETSAFLCISLNSGWCGRRIRGSRSGKARRLLSSSEEYTKTAKAVFLDNTGKFLTGAKL